MSATNGVGNIYSPACKPLFSDHSSLPPTYVCPLRLTFPSTDIRRPIFSLTIRRPTFLAVGLSRISVGPTFPPMSSVNVHWCVFSLTLYCLLLRLGSVFMSLLHRLTSRTGHVTYPRLSPCLESFISFDLPRVSARLLAIPLISSDSRLSFT
jgi:hypothetical protein